MEHETERTLHDLVASQQILIAKVDGLCQAVEQLVRLVESLQTSHGTVSRPEKEATP